MRILLFFLKMGDTAPLSAKAGSLERQLPSPDTLRWDPMIRPTNTDGVNPDSSRHVLIEDRDLLVQSVSGLGFRV